MNRKNAIQLFNHCKRVDPNRKHPAYDNIKELFIKYCEEGEVVDAVSIFGNFKSFARHEFVLYCHYNKLISKEDFSKALAHVYTDQNRTPGFKHIIGVTRTVKLFKSADRNYLMTKRERNYLNKQPEIITIYRGGIIEKDNEISASQTGFSWTLKERAAKFFSEYYAAGNPDVKRVVLKGKVNKNDVLAYFNQRKEFEVICNPSKVYDITAKYT